MPDVAGAAGQRGEPSLPSPAVFGLEPAAAADAEATAARLRAILLQSPVSTQIVGTDGYTTAANPAFFRLWGIGPDVLRGYNLLQDPLLERNGIRGHIERAMAGEAVQIPAVRYDPAEAGQPGRARWVRAVAYPVKDAQGRVREVVVQHEDVTHEVESTEALRESREQYRLLVEGARTHAIVLLDPQGRITNWGEGASILTGYAAEEVLGRDVSIFYTPQDVAAGRPAWLLEEALRLGRVEEEGWRVRKDGARYWARVSTSPIRDATGALRGFGRVVEDLTDRKLAEDELRRLNAALREAQQATQRLLSMASHELKTPLTPVALQVGILRRRGGLSAAQEASLDILERNVRRLQALVDEILDAVQVQEGLPPSTFEEVDLAALAGAAVEAARRQSHADGVELAWTPPPRPLPVRGDRKRLLQAATALLLHCIRGTSPRGRITVSAHAQDGWATLRVHDDEVVLSAEERAFVLELFGARSDGHPPATGSVVGIYLSRLILEAHGGGIEVQARDGGGGTTYRCRLPMLGAPGTPTDTASVPAGTAAPGAAPPTTAAAPPATAGAAAISPAAGAAAAPPPAGTADAAPRAEGTAAPPPSA